MFLPYVLPIPVVAVIFGQMLQLDGSSTGLLRGWARLARVGLARAAGLGLWTMTGVIIWKELGFGVVIFSPGSSPLPVEMFEAARVDGARSSGSTVS